MKTSPVVLAALAFSLTTGWSDSASAHRLTKVRLEDKIRGGWAGQMIGVAYGAPTEFHARGRTFDAPLAWAPERIENAIHQDDLYVEMTFAAVLDEHGLDATAQQFAAAFRDSEYSLWHANAASRKNLGRGLNPPDSGHPRYNFHANDIDFQIEADFIGLMAPGLPRLSNTLCDRVGRIMNYGDGLYGGMFVCGMYAAAFVEPDPRRVVEAGLACIPAQSTYARLIQDLLDWSKEEPDDWRKTWLKLDQKWNRNDPCPDGALTGFNIDAKLNGGYIAMGLLYGKGDFGKIVEIATRCGQDSDCNPSSAAGIFGVMAGYEAIPDEWKSGLDKIRNVNFEFTGYSFESIVDSTMRRALDAIKREGGEVLENEVVLPLQTPVAPPLEQWDPGVPVQRLRCDGAAWKWTGDWQLKNGAMMAASAGAEAVLEFEGRAILVIGRHGQDGGRAEVFLNGQPLGTADAYIVERTYDNDFFHWEGITPGRQTLRFVVSDKGDPRSRGRTVSISGAVVYRAGDESPSD